MVFDGMDVRDSRRSDPASSRGVREAGRYRALGRHVCRRHLGDTRAHWVLRWVFVVPPLALLYQEGDSATRTAVAAGWLAQHQFGGALLGEHLGQLLGIGWSVTLSIVVLRSRVLPRWIGIAGLVVSAHYLFNQGDILATALPGFPVFDLAGLIGSSGWGLWIAALGVVLLLRLKAPDQALSADQSASASS